MVSRTGSAIVSAATGNTRMGANDMMRQLKDTMIQLDHTLEMYEDRADEQLKKTHDKVVKKATQMVLNKLGKTVESSLKPAYLPPSLVPVIDFMYHGTWPDVCKHLEEMILMGSGYDASDYLATSRMLHWPNAPELWGAGGAWRSIPPRPFAWLRAKVLYALKPADANKFKHLHDPVALAIVMLKLCPYYGISVLMFVLMWFWIERSDEGQLVFFVLSFKSFQFISGLSSTAFLCFHLWECLELTTLNSGTTCESGAPGQGSTFPFLMVLEVTRILLLLSAGILLGGGASYGGAEELYALEHVRLQRARGELGPTAVEAAAQQGTGTGKVAPEGLGAEGGVGGGADGGGYERLEGSGEHRPEAAATSPGCQPLSRAVVQRALAAARLRFGVQRGYGGYVPYFMLYDLLVILSLVAYLAWHAYWLRVQGAPVWLFWTTCYYMKLMWALASFPYLVFIVPILGQALHQSKSTAYDQSGMLVPLLSGVMIKKKKVMDEEAELRRNIDAAAVAHGSATSVAALNIQRMYRGKEARKVHARLARHFMHLATPVGLFVPADSIEKWFS